MGRDKVKEASMTVVLTSRRSGLETRGTVGSKFPGRSVATHPWTPTREVPSGQQR